MHTLFDAFRCAVVAVGHAAAQQRLAGAERNWVAMPRAHDALMRAKLFDRRIVQRATEMIANGVNGTNILSEN